MFQRSRPFFLRTINFRQRMETRRHPRLIPSRLVKRIVSFAVTLEKAEAQAEIVERFAIHRIGIAAREPADGVAKQFFRFREFTAFEMPQAERVVAAGIQWIAPQRLAPISRRRSRGVAILLKMQTGDEQFVVARDVFRSVRLGGWRRNFAFPTRFALIGN